MLFCIYGLCRGLPIESSLLSSTWHLGICEHLERLSHRQERPISCQCADGLVHLNLSTCRGTSPIASHQILAVLVSGHSLYPGHAPLHIDTIPGQWSVTYHSLSPPWERKLALDLTILPGKVVYCSSDLHIWLSLGLQHSQPKGSSLRVIKRKNSPHSQYLDHHLLLLGLNA